MRTSLLSALLMGLLLPAAIPAADPWEDLLENVDELQQEVQRGADREMWDALDSREMSGSDLLPVPGGADLPDVAPVDDSPTVRVTVDGKTLELKDVPKGSWFAPYVRAVAQAGLVSGYRGKTGKPLGLYGPADSVTIEQIAKIAILAANVDPAACSGTLLNTKAKGQWSESFIRCAEQQRWAVYADGSVDPLRPATRAEVVVTVLQAFAVAFEPSDAAPFRDVDSSTEFRSAILTAHSDHIVSGYTRSDGSLTGTFGPTDPVNRAEVAKIVTLVMQVYGD
jgi:hypothetical protein